MVENMIKWILVGVGIATLILDPVTTIVGNFVTGAGITIPLKFIAAGLIVLGAWMQ